MSSGPLASLRVVEIASLGPGPFAAMLLADLGADVIRVDRPEPIDREPPPELDVLTRGRRSVVVDLKNPSGAAVVLRLCERADALIEGFRPGVVERLGIGPDVCAQRNPALVFGRVTGWGQDGPYAQMAGHDIDYIAVSGVLDAIGPRGGAPVPPLNLVGDYAGGATFAFGLVAAILEARESGRGQVIDSAMLDTTIALSAHFHGLRAAEIWRGTRGENMLDGGAPFYTVYETSDDRFVAVGAIEERFYAELLSCLELRDLPSRTERTNWPAIRARIAAAFASRTRDEWAARFEGTDACVVPVLAFDEVARHPQVSTRGSLVEIDGLEQPAATPRFSRTPAAVRRGPTAPGRDADAALASWGFAEAEIAELRRDGAIR